MIQYCLGAHIQHCLRCLGPLEYHNTVLHFRDIQFEFFKRGIPSFLLITQVLLFGIKNIVNCLWIRSLSHTVWLKFVIVAWYQKLFFWIPARHFELSVQLWWLYVCTYGVVPVGGATWLIIIFNFIIFVIITIINFITMIIIIIIVVADVVVITSSLLLVLFYYNSNKIKRLQIVFIFLLIYFQTPFPDDTTDLRSKISMWVIW